MPHRGIYPTPLSDMESAVRRVIDQLYAGFPAPSQIPLSDRTKRKTQRNNEIRALYVCGESIATLAKRFGVSEQRIHQIVSSHEC